MPKQLNIIVDKCDECPYCQYNGDYGMSYDSGWDCKHDKAPYPDRIVDDCVVRQYNEDMEKYNKSQDTLFPMSIEEKPKDPFVIPSWCPLPDDESLIINDTH